MWEGMGNQGLQASGRGEEGYSLRIKLILNREHSKSNRKHCRSATLYAAIKNMYFQTPKKPLSPPPQTKMKITTVRGVKQWVASPTAGGESPCCVCFSAFPLKYPTYPPTCAMSANASSMLMMSMSRTGSTLPSTWMMSESSKHRTTDRSSHRTSSFRRHRTENHDGIRETHTQQSIRVLQFTVHRTQCGSSSVVNTTFRPTLIGFFLTYQDTTGAHELSRGALTHTPVSDLSNKHNNEKHTQARTTVVTSVTILAPLDMNQKHPVPSSKNHCHSKGRQRQQRRRPQLRQSMATPVPPI